MVAVALVIAQHFLLQSLHIRLLSPPSLSFPFVADWPFSPSALDSSSSAAFAPALVSAQGFDYVADEVARGSALEACDFLISQACHAPYALLSRPYGGCGLGEGVQGKSDVCGVHQEPSKELEPLGRSIDSPERYFELQCVVLVIAIYAIPFLGFEALTRSIFSRGTSPGATSVRRIKLRTWSGWKRSGSQR